MNEPSSIPSGITADGKEFYSWNGGWNRLSLNPAMGKGASLGIGALSCVYRIRTLALIPISK